MNLKLPDKFKPFRKVRLLGDMREIYIFGFKILSYRKMDFLRRYKKLFKSAGYELSQKEDGFHIVGNGLYIFGTAHNTLWSTNYVILGEEYKFDSNNNDEYVVFDIGLNIGLASLYFAGKDNISEIYSFEPFVPTFKVAERNMELNPNLAKKIHIFNFGLSDHEDTLDIGYNPDLPGAMSSMPGHSELQDNSEKEKIVLKVASDILGPLFEKHSDKKILIKMDVEGAEREILPNLDKAGLLKKVDILLMEYHDGYSKPLADILEKNGMKTEITGPSKNNVGMINAYRK